MADLQGMPNPDPILRAEGKSIAVYRTFVDGHLGAVRRKRLAAVRGKPWSIVRGNASARATARVEELFRSWDMRGLRKSVHSAVDYGYSILEPVWDRMPGWCLPVRLLERPQEWFQFGLRGETRFLSDSGGNEIVPPRKALVTRHMDDPLNPYGYPILSECFWPLALKRGSLRYWAQFAERFGLPKTVGKVPSNTPEHERHALLRKLQMMIGAGAVVIPENGKVELLETKIAGSLPYPPLVRWADAEISKAYLGETLTTEITTGAGSRAAAEVHNDVRLEGTLDDINMEERTFNQLIQWIWEVNSIPGPPCRYEVQLPQDLRLSLIKRDQALYKLGVRFDAQYIAETYNIPIERIKVIEQKAASGGLDLSSDAAFAEFLPDRPEQILQALLSELSDGEIGAQARAFAQPIMDMAASATGYSEFLDMLDKRFTNLGDTQIEQALEKFCVLSELAGATDGMREASAALDDDA